MATKDETATASAAGASGSSDASVTKCSSCGSTQIDVDPSRAECVCTGCGEVLSASMIVSDIQFEENAHGGASAIGEDGCIIATNRKFVLIRLWAQV